MSRRDCHCGGDGSDGCRIDEAAALTSGRVPGVGVLVAVIQAVLLGCGYIVWQLKVLTDTNPELIVWLLAGVIGAVFEQLRLQQARSLRPLKIFPVAVGADLAVERRDVPRRQ